MSLLTHLRRWRFRMRAERHRRWLRKARVIADGPAPNPRCVVRRRWNVPL